MSKTKNIFAIGRKGHEGDENQLSEMIAYLFQQEPQVLVEWLSMLGLGGVEGPWRIGTQHAVGNGFIDVVATSPGKAFIAIESKLGSTTSFDQITKYVEYAKARKASQLKALVFLTQHPEPWPAGADREAGEVKLVRCRWQELGQVLAASQIDLATQFATMLAEEGIVMPEAMSANDWEMWNAGARLSRGLATLLTEVGERVQSVEPKYRTSGSVQHANNGLIYRLFHFEGISVGLGFWPTRKPKRPEDFAMVVCYVLNTAIPVTERKAAGVAAVEALQSDGIEMSDWSEYYVMRSESTQQILKGGSFSEQCTELADYARGTIERLRKGGYLTPKG